MAQTASAPSTATPPAEQVPGRRVLVGLSVLILVLFAVMLATSHDVSYDTSTARINDAYDVSQTTSQVSAYGGMAFVALLLFFGAALRGALRRSAASWFADSAFLGFAALAATFASWIVTDVAMWKAVDTGTESTIRAVATISDAGFLPLMASMMALYVGTGLAGLTTRSLPRWLAIASVIIGVISPLGPLGVIGFMLLPLWIVAVSAWVRLDA